ncbi:hypothetical protein C8Q80DRAFT_1276476 [Daedaleopsis nitida]|nr:hypothetical protein C8Q80DRAFT_1276476 [Daedaleopsis nitida]
MAILSQLARLPKDDARISVSMTTVGNGMTTGGIVIDKDWIDRTQRGLVDRLDLDGKQTGRLRTLLNKLLKNPSQAMVHAEAALMGAAVEGKLPSDVLQATAADERDKIGSRYRT